MRYFTSYLKKLLDQRNQSISLMLSVITLISQLCFSTINAVLNTPQATCLEPSAEMCETFLHFFY